MNNDLDLAFKLGIFHATENNCTEDADRIREIWRLFKPQECLEWRPTREQKLATEAIELLYKLRLSGNPAEIKALAVKVESLMEKI